MAPETLTTDTDERPAGDVADERPVETQDLEDELLVEEVSIDGMCGVY
jgi:mycofactocin precursor